MHVYLYSRTITIVVTKRTIEQDASAIAAVILSSVLVEVLLSAGGFIVCSQNLSHMYNVAVCRLSCVVK